MARTQYSDDYLRDGVIVERQTKRIDPATLLGLFAAFGLVALAMTIGGSPKSFLDAPALLIVLGGTFGVTTIAFSLDDVLRTQTIVARTIFRTVPDPQQTARKMMEFALVARQRGPLAIEEMVEDQVSNPLGHSALRMVVDGHTPEEIEDILKKEIEEMAIRHDTGANILRKAAETAPAMGLIGTLIGLVQMLGNLDDPASIGPNMAIALLTTFYGAVLSSMFFSPLASKLERNSEKETLNARVYMYAAAAISRQDNPRRLEALLNALLPPANRISSFA